MCNLRIIIVSEVLSLHKQRTGKLLPSVNAKKIIQFFIQLSK